MSDAGRLMDVIYARQRHIYDVTRKFYLLGRDQLIKGLDAKPGDTILEIGCGTGRNLIAIARSYPDCRCHGLDVSKEMLVTARQSVSRAGLQSRIALAEADATAFDPLALFGVASFDRVVISYALSMIPPWRDVLRGGADALSPDGSLHIVDFGDQAGLPRAFKSALEAWLARFHVSPRRALPEAIRDLARDRDLDGTTQSLFRGYAIAGRLGPYAQSRP